MAWDQQPIKGYLVDADTGERLEFQYNPNSISDEKSTDYATIKIPGMSHPRYQYVAGEPRRIAFKVELFNRRTRDNHSVKAFVLHLIKCLVKSCQVMRRGVFRGV
jgi:hypothetical protein